MERDTARLAALIKKVAKAREPSRPLLAEVWFETAGRQDADTKVRFAFFMQAEERQRAPPARDQIGWRR